MSELKPCPSCLEHAIADELYDPPTGERWVRCSDCTFNASEEDWEVYPRIEIPDEGEIKPFSDENGNLIVDIPIGNGTFRKGVKANTAAIGAWRMYCYLTGQDPNTRAPAPDKDQAALSNLTSHAFELDSPLELATVGNSVETPYKAQPDKGVLEIKLAKWLSDPKAGVVEAEELIQDCLSFFDSLQSSQDSNSVSISREDAVELRKNRIHDMAARGFSSIPDKLLDRLEQALSQGESNE